MVVQLLRLDSAPTPADASDALALAICHVWRGAAAARLDEAVARAQHAQATAARLARARAAALAKVAR